MPPLPLDLPNPRVVGMLVGDIKRNPSDQTKYGWLFQSIGRRFPLVDVYDATLRGVPKLVNALQTVHPDRRVWRERFYKNVPAFRTRSRHMVARIDALEGQADLTFQVGALFDPCIDRCRLPNIIYTDYTALLAAQKPEGGRAPFSKAYNDRLIALERRAFEHAGHIFVRSNIVRSSIVIDYGIDTSKVTTVGGGVNLGALPQLRATPLSETPTVLFIGKEFHRKGGDLLVQAFAKARRMVPTARLVVVTGETPAADLPLDGVDVIRTAWNRELVERLYRTSDVFALTSRLETWGDVVLEAMAYGLPCIGVAGEPMEEIIVDGVTGRVVPPQDVDALARALAEMLSDPSKCRAWGVASRQRVEHLYTWDAVVDQMVPAIVQVHARCVPAEV